MAEKRHISLIYDCRLWFRIYQQEEGKEQEEGAVL